MADFHHLVHPRGELFRLRGIRLQPIETTESDKKIHQHAAQHLESRHRSPPSTAPNFRAKGYNDEGIEEHTQEHKIEGINNMQERTSRNKEYGLSIYISELYCVRLARHQGFFNNRPLYNCLDEEHFVPGQFLKILDQKDMDRYVSEALLESSYLETCHTVSYFESRGRHPAQVRKFWDGVRAVLKDDDFEYQDWPPITEQSVVAELEEEGSHTTEIKEFRANRKVRLFVRDWKENAEYRQEVRGYLKERSQKASEDGRAEVLNKLARQVPFSGNTSSQAPPPESLKAPSTFEKIRKKWTRSQQKAN